QSAEGRRLAERKNAVHSDPVRIMPSTRGASPSSTVADR
ncbi:nitrate reductase molybdenum cofactor assembly chaperone, partial [Vreelandella rituensis]